MPGIIQVSVLEAVDLPEAFTDRAVGKDVTAKVILGRRLYKTQPGIADSGKIDSWKSNFNFPVLNLRDKLVVAICNNEDQSISQTTIEISSIIEKGSRDEFVELEGGGRLHLRTSFVLTDDERKKIETMRLATSKRREEDRLKRTVVFQSLHPVYDDEGRESPVSTVTITDADMSSTDERKSRKDASKGPLRFGSTTKPRAPTVKFDYARALGSQSGQNYQREDWRSINSSNDDKLKNRITGLEGQNVRGSARDSSELLSTESSRIEASVVSPRRKTAVSSMKRLVRRVFTTSLPIISQSPCSGRLLLDTVKPSVQRPERNFSEGQGDVTKSATEQQKDTWSIGKLTGQNMLNYGAPAMATSRREDCIYVGRQLDNRVLDGCSEHLAHLEQMQQWDRHRKIRSVCAKVESLRIDSGHGQRSNVRSGQVARWSHKTGLESRWAFPRKARRIIREYRVGRVSDHLRARTKIFELIKAAGCAHASCGDFRGFQEHHSLADGFGTVLNKVVGGAAMFLTALFIIWPLVEGSPDGDDDLTAMVGEVRANSRVLSNRLSYF